MSLETIEFGGVRYAEVIWADTRVATTTFFSPAKSSFQFGLLAHEAGFVEEPHFHQPFKREINDLQQMFVVQRGVVAVDLFGDDGDESVGAAQNRLPQRNRTAYLRSVRERALHDGARHCR